MKRFWQRLLQNERGIALIEFAIAVPFLLLLIFGGAEATRYILVNQKLEKAGYVLTDITTQFQQQSAVVPKPGELTEAMIQNDIFPQMARVMQPFDRPENQAVIFTSLVQQGAQKIIKWQVVGGGSLTTNVVSQVSGLAASAIIPAAVSDRPATLPPDVDAALGTLAPDENIIIGEMFFRYTPLYMEALRGAQGSNPRPFLIESRTLSKTIFLRPRNNAFALVCLPPNFVYPECLSIPPTGGGGTCQPTTRCEGDDNVTRDCDGFITTRVDCGCKPPVSACEGPDYVTRTCKGIETARVARDRVHGCFVCTTTSSCEGLDFVTRDCDNNETARIAAAPQCAAPTPAPTPTPAPGCQDGWTAEYLGEQEGDAGACMAYLPFAGNCAAGPGGQEGGTAPSSTGNRTLCISKITGIDRNGLSNLCGVFYRDFGCLGTGGDSNILLGVRRSNPQRCCSKTADANGICVGPFVCGTPAPAPTPRCAAGWSAEYLFTQEGVAADCLATAASQGTCAAGPGGQQGGTEPSSTGRTNRCSTRVEGLNLSVCSVFSRDCGCLPDGSTHASSGVPAPQRCCNGDADGNGICGGVAPPATCGGSFTGSMCYNCDADDITCPTTHRLVCNPQSRNGPVGIRNWNECSCVLDATCAAPVPAPVSCGPNQCDVTNLVGRPDITLCSGPCVDIGQDAFVTSQDGNGRNARGTCRRGNPPRIATQNGRRLECL